MVLWINYYTTTENTLEDGTTLRLNNHVLQYIKNDKQKPQIHNVIQYLTCLTYQLKLNFMDSFNFWHGHIYLFLDFELELLSLSCLLRLKILSNNELLLESLFLWLLFLLQLCLQLSELFSTAFNSREEKTVKLLF